MANKFYLGTDGKDIIDTLNGNDTDTIDGKGNADTLTGSPSGVDIFRFSTPLDGTITDILDFKKGDDYISLDSSVFTSLTTGVLSSTNIRAGAFTTAATPTQYIIYNTITGNLYYDADGSGTNAPPILFANVKDGSPGPLKANDLTNAILVDAVPTGMNNIVLSSGGTLTDPSVPDFLTAAKLTYPPPVFAFTPITLTTANNGVNGVLIAGNAGDNKNGLTGNSATDILMGLEGNDTYYVNNSSVQIKELALPGGGKDTVIASVTYTLPANVEDLTLTGTANINGTGNGEDNVITGNDGNNVLDGGAGNDSLEGGLGDDTLIGGTGDDILIGGPGADTYRFIMGDGLDTIIDDENDANIVEFGPGISKDAFEVTVSADGKDLYLQYNDGDVLTLSNWFVTRGMIDSFIFADDLTGTLVNAQDLLISLLPPLPAPTFMVEDDVDPITGNVSNQGSTNDPTPAFYNGTAEPGAEITITIEFSDGTTTITATTTADTSGAWSYDWQDGQIGPLDEGTYTAKVTQYHGGKDSAAASFTFTVDRTPPDIAPDAVTTVVAGDNILNIKEAAADTVTLTGTVNIPEDAVKDKSTLTLTVDGNDIGVEATINDDGTWDATVPTSVLLAATTPEVGVTLTVEDVAGNSSSRTFLRPYSFDSDVPDAPGVVPANDTGIDGDRITSDATVILTGIVDKATLQFSFDKDNDDAWQPMDYYTTIDGVTMSDAANRLEDGTYPTVYVRQLNEAGNPSLPFEFESFTLDREAPVIAATAVTTVVADDNILNKMEAAATDVTLTGTVDIPADAVKSKSTLGLTIDGNDYSATINDDGTWDATVPTSVLLAATTKEVGVTLTVEDVAGNSSSSTFTQAYTIDQDAPVAPGVGLASDTGASASDLITKDGTLSYTDVEDDATLQYSIDDGATWSDNFTAAEGVNTVLVRQTDVAGNESDASTPLTFTLDTTAPATPTITGADDAGPISSGGRTKDTTPVFSGAGETGATVTITIKYGTTTTTATTTVTDDTWTYAPGALTAGATYTVTAQQTDVAGNVSALSDPLNFTLEQMVPDAPTFTVADKVSPVTGDLTSGDSTNDPQPVFSGTAEPNATVTITITIGDGTTTPITATVTVGDDGKWNYTPDALGEETYTVAVTQTTADGTSPETPFTFTVDTTAPDAPTLTVTDNVDLITGALTSGDSTNDPQPVFGGTAEPNATVTITINGGPSMAPVTATVMAGSDGAWTYTPGAPLVESDYTVSVTQTDKAGNNSPAALFGFTLDTTPPNTTGTAITFDQVTGDNVLKTSEVAGDVLLTGTVTGMPEDAATKTLVLTLNGVDYAATINGAGIWSATVKGSDLVLDSDKKVDAKLTVADEAGNSAEVTNSSSPYTVAANVIMGTPYPDDLTGLNGDDIIYALASNDTLTGGNGDDLLDGGPGADVMSGGKGDDFYVVDDEGDEVIEAVNSGNDTVLSSITYELPANVENLILTGTDNINGTGNELDNVITGNGGNNILDGGLGADTMSGGAGNDTYVVDNVGDVVSEDANAGIDTVQSSITYTLTPNVENLTLMVGAGAINGTGNELDNVIIGNNANNTLYGLAGNDTMNGGGGSDTVYGGAGNDILKGGTGNDILHGGAGDDCLDGEMLPGYSYKIPNWYAAVADRSGADTMYGGAGNDCYFVDNVGDKVVEYAGQGYDRVYASISYTLPANVEFLWLMGTEDLYGIGNNLDNYMIGNEGSNILIGGAGNDTLVGQGGADTLWGDSGNDILSGGTGPDLMRGGIGNDWYSVDDPGDVVVEFANEGRDRVNASISYTLGANVEDLVLSGTADINGTGNSLNNYIRGNTGANLLNGGAGNDILIGGGGNDTLWGAAGNDVLSGGTGADLMAGGAGNDWYSVDDAGDVVVEKAGGGRDRVNASISYTLGANVEDLVLSGTANLKGTGNNLDNVIIGNSGNNFLSGGAGNDILRGGAGNDTLYGGSGNDILTGGAGADTIVFASIFDGVDTITDFTSGEDRILVTGQLARNELKDLVAEMNANDGVLSAKRFVANNTGVATNASQRIIYNLKTGALLYDADGTGSGVATQFATLGNKPANLKAGDFFTAAS